MEPFQIQCATCLTPLNVHRGDVIGQIHACPRCGSMVLVERPGEDADPIGADPTASTDRKVSTLKSARDDSSRTDALVPVWADSKPMAWRQWGLYLGAAALGTAGTLVVYSVAISWLGPRNPPEVRTETKRGAPAHETVQDADQPAAPEDTAVLTGSELNHAQENFAASQDVVAGEDDDTPIVGSPQTVDSSETGDAETDNGSNQETDERRPAASDQEAEQPDRAAVADLTATHQTGSITKTDRPNASVDLETRLGDSIPAIKFNGTGLLECLRFLTEFSTIPITVPPEALLFARRTPSSRVQLESSETTVREVLTEVLATQRLMVRVDDRHVVVTNQSDDPSGMREICYRVDDLLSPSSESVDELVELIQRFVAPVTWDDAGTSIAVHADQRALVIRQLGPVHWEALSFCERLRVARSLPLRSPFQPTLFDLKTRTARARAKLHGRLTLNYHRPTRLVDILERLREEVGIDFLVDWQSLYEIGWFPATRTTLLASDKPLRELLELLLLPNGLDFRVVDASLIQVTTASSIENLADVEFYPVADFLSAGLPALKLESRIRETVGQGWFAPGRGALHFDKASSYLIVRLPQRQQQQLARQLEAWKNNSS